jgi:D-alanine-D-alanine ligase
LVELVDVTRTPEWYCQLRRYDLVVINLHGEPGEDGSIQGLLRVNEVKFVGSDVEASVLAVNKYLTKLVAIAAGVPTPRFCLVTGDMRGDASAIGADRLCKPLRGGSSVGILRLAAGDPVPASGHWLVEEFLPGIDVTVTVVEAARSPVSLPAVVLRHPGEFYDAAAKLGLDADLKAVAIRPEDLGSVLSRCEAIAMRMHQSIGARHLSRSDFVVSSGQPYFLEINTLPGISEISNSAECAYAADLDYDDFISLIVGAAFDD